MEIPIHLEDGPDGRLRLIPEGLYLRFEAELPPREGLQRLYVHGGGASACLGLLEPGEGVLRLSRRLSRMERERLPEPIEYASLSPSPRGSAPPAPPPAGCWQRRADGSLVDEERRIVALPCALRRENALLRTAEIGGQRYLLFRY